MDYFEKPPGPALRSRVHCFWSLRGELGASPVGTRERVVPDGRMEWILHLGEPFAREVGGELRRQSTALWAGVTTGPLFLVSNARVEVVGVRFRPGGLAGLRANRRSVLEACELRDDVASASQVGASFLEEWVDPLREIHGTAARLAALEARVEREFQGCPVSPLVAALGALGPDPRSLDLARRYFGGSLRHLERLASREVGISPKQLQRTLRFQAVADRLTRAETTNLKAWAAELGYSDQAHLTREFRSFAGLSPLRYRAEVHGFSDALITAG